MIKSNTLLFVIFLLSQMVLGQIGREKVIRGKIGIDSVAVEGVNIANSSNGKTTISDKSGFFSMLAKEGDVLVFSAVNLETLRKKISKQDLVSDVIQVQVTPVSVALKEVVINEHPEISAENLGVIPYGQKKYTPAERKLKTAGDFKPIHLLGLLGGSIAGDPIINKITGRTQMLKKEIKVERKEFWLKQLGDMFDEKYFVSELKIPTDYVKGFQYYIVENERFVETLKSKNKTMTTFLMGELSLEYNEIIACEK